MRLESDIGVAARPKKIWIDLDNTPHVPFFAPIMEELQRRGYSLLVTARDCFQVCSLADLLRLPYRRVGRHYGKHRMMKVLGTTYRGVQLLPLVLRNKPNLAVSHGSRSQLVAATIAQIPSVVIFDYEFAKPFPGIAPTWVMAPDLIPGCKSQFGGRILKYPGIKEDVYVPAFKPDFTLLSRLGLDGNCVLVTLRPPADEAHYHNPESEVLFRAVVDLLSQASEAKIVLLPRNERQAFGLRRSWPDLFATGKMRIPEHALDGLNLIWHSDLVIGGGGTMNREAAALGVPVYSIFRGPIGEIDRYLARTGRLVLLESIQDVHAKIHVCRRDKTPRTEMVGTSALKVIVEHITTIVESSTMSGSAVVAVTPNR